MPVPRDDATADAWKRRFRAPAVLSATLARGNPARGLATSNLSGVVQLYAWDVPTADLRQVTHRPEGVVQGWISPDGGHIYHLDDRGGDERGHIARLPYGGGVAQDVTPDLPPYAVSGLAFDRAGTRLALIATTADGVDLYAIDAGPDGALGPPRRLYHGAKLAARPLLSFGGGLVAMASTERATAFQFHQRVFDPADGSHIADLWDGPGISVEARMFAPHKGDDRLLAMTNRSGVQRPLIWAPRTGERLDLPLPSLDGDVVPTDWSPDRRRLLLCQTHRAIQHLYEYDLEAAALTRLAHPSGTQGLASYAPGGEIWLPWHDSTHPQQLIALDGTTGRQTRVVLAAGAVPPGHPWRSVSFPSMDGETVQGWLALPDGEGPYPTILDLHGGPMTVATDLFLPSSQAWLDHGYAFFSLNYRGSTTFGRDFQQKIYGDLGHWEVEDMVAAREWLVGRGIARPDAVIAAGASYGGYLTLQALGTHPALWAAGIASIAVADRVSQYEDASEAHKRGLVALFGGTPDEKREQYAVSSPITYADRVRAPVLVIQGRNDSRCPARQMELYEARMKALGKRIEVHWFEAGHLAAFAQIEQAIDHQELMLRFADRVIGDTQGL